MRVFLALLALIWVTSLNAEVALVPLAIDTGFWEVRYIRAINGKQEVRHVCLEKKDLTMPILSHFERRSSCRLIPVESSSRAQILQIKCLSDEVSALGQLHTVVVDGKYFKGERQLTISDSGIIGEHTPENQNSTFSATWIRANCGPVRSLR